MFSPSIFTSIPLNTGHFCYIPKGGSIPLNIHLLLKRQQGGPYRTDMGRKFRRPHGQGSGQLGSPALKGGWPWGPGSPFLSDEGGMLHGQARAVHLALRQGESWACLRTLVAQHQG